jgi:hypothetical protein
MNLLVPTKADTFTMAKVADFENAVASKKKVLTLEFKMRNPYLMDIQHRASIV